MEITFVWSWLSFFAGVAVSFIGSVALLFAVAYKQWKKQKVQKDSVEKMFANWGGRDNSSL
jgi:hypothetical protein